jgi:hypothetical protein
VFCAGFRLREVGNDTRLLNRSLASVGGKEIRLSKRALGSIGVSWIASGCCFQPSLSGSVILNSDAGGLSGTADPYNGGAFQGSSLNGMSFQNLAAALASVQDGPFNVLGPYVTTGTSVFAYEFGSWNPITDPVPLEQGFAICYAYAPNLFIAVGSGAQFTIAYSYGFVTSDQFNELPPVWVGVSGSGALFSYATSLVYIFLSINLLLFTASRAAGWLSTACRIGGWPWGVPQTAS